MDCLLCGHEHYHESDPAGFDVADDVPWGVCKQCSCKCPDYNPHHAIETLRRRCGELKQAVGADTREAGGPSKQAEVSREG